MGWDVNVPVKLHIYVMLRQGWGGVWWDVNVLVKLQILTKQNARLKNTHRCANKHMASQKRIRGETVIFLKFASC